MAETLFGTLTPDDVRVSRRDKELASLFGMDLVQKAKATDPADLNLTADLMAAVHDSADGLMVMAGCPRAQRELINDLNEETRLALCMWIQDMELSEKLAYLSLSGAA